MFFPGIFMSDVGQLYVVATPIGNLGDITLRAITVLKQVDTIAAEDTRQSKKLLRHYGITTPMLSVHAHNERVQAIKIVDLLKNNQSVAYITDAGTPLISDPGAYLIQIVRDQGYAVIPIPGPCAAITALSVSGFTTPHFYFEGFLPSKPSQRKLRLERLKDFQNTLIFYESPHRIMATLLDSLEILGNRHAVIARELTKKFETILSGSLEELRQSLVTHPQQQLGEFVLLISGNEESRVLPQKKMEVTLRILLKELPLKQAVSLASDLLGVAKNDLYCLALQMKDSP
jgi:16S rRNA (cytidine1402-2'-O)-methyltransferase